MSADHDSDRRDSASNEEHSQRGGVTSGVQIDVYGVKVSVTPSPLDEIEPDTWRLVAQTLNRQLMAIVSNTISLAADILRSARSIVRGLGSVSTSLAKRVGDAHALADHAEAQRALESEWSEVESPSEVAQRIEEFVTRLRKLGLSAEVSLEPKTNHVVICLLPRGDRKQIEDIASAALLTAIPYSPLAPSETSAPELMFVDETSERLRRALAALSPGEADLIRSVFIENRSKEQVLREFGVGSEAFTKLLHRVKKKFRRELGRKK